ncbi:MAG: tetratricopeptide repeat protein [Verrucomicrobiia bacterium]|jgi:Flp pilus assembly protein TadD
MGAHQFIFILLLVWYFIRFYSVAADIPEIVERVKPSILVVLSYAKEGNVVGQGTGFFISYSGEVITCRHVVANAERVVVKTSTGRIYAVLQIVAEDVAGDIARLAVRIPSSEVKPLQLSSTAPREGERIIVIGNPLGLELTVSDGIISAFRNTPNGRMIQFTAPISPGSSGSPVFNMKGEVVGIVNGGKPEGQNLNFAVPSERIAKLNRVKGKIFGGQIGTTPLPPQQPQAPKEDALAKGLNYLEKEEFKTALAYFEEVARLNPDNARVHFYIGVCKQAIGESAEAIEAFSAAIRLKADYAEAYYGLGVSYDELKKYSEASLAYNQAIRINPAFSEAYNNVGVSYSYLGRYSDAVEFFERAINLSPQSPEPINNFGVFQAKFGRRQEAIELFKQAIRIDPDFADAHYNLGCAYHLIGDKMAALEEYRILKEINRDLAERLFELVYK